MGKVVLLLAVALLLALPVFSQESYKAEFFGGYQYTRLGGANFNGWNASATLNANSWLGVTGDVSAAYKSQNGAHLDMYNFLFGPTFSYNKSQRVKPFAHTLFGVSHASAGFLGISGSGNAFAMALGGGVDAGVHKNVAVRLVQADYFLTRFGGESQNGARISTGLTLRF